MALVVGVAITVEATEFARQAAVFFSMPIFEDGRMSFPMGRAWLNDLAFYQDLFENKPPLMLVLTGLSLHFSNGPMLHVVVQLILLLGIGPALSLFVWRQAANAPRTVRLMAAGAAWLFGMCMAVQVVVWSEGYQTEGFGVALATGAALLFGVRARTGRRVALDVAAAGGLGLAAMLKEPFGVAGVLAMAMLCEGSVDVRRLVRVVVGSGLVAACVLFVTGAFADYFAIYLPEMFGGRVIRGIVYTHYGLGLRFNVPTPLWARGLEVYKIFAGLAWPPAKVMLLGFVVASVAVFAPQRARSTSWLTVAASGGLIFGVVLVEHQYFMLRQLVGVITVTGKAIPWTSGTMLERTAWVVLPLIGIVGVLALMRWKRETRVALWAAVVATSLYLVSVIVGYGGDYLDRHLLFAFPLLLVIGASVIARAAVDRQTVLLASLVSMLVFHAAIPGKHVDAARRAWLAQTASESLVQRRLAGEIDAVLDRCRVDRYLMADLELLAIPAYTRHSPYQLFMGHLRSIGSAFGPAGVAEPNAFLARKLEQDLAAAMVIVQSSKAEAVGLHPMVAQTIARDFTTVPPDCVKGELPGPEVTMSFRHR